MLNIEKARHWFIAFWKTEYVYFINVQSLKQTKQQHKRGEENQLDATERFYCTYNLLNMFRALICPSSVSISSS